MTDRLAGFFNQHQLSARMFFSGTLCKDIDFDESMGGGFLHLIQKGKLTVNSSEHGSILIDQPSLLLYPRPAKHQFVFDGEVDLTCAIIDLDGGSKNVLANALPRVMLMPLDLMPSLANTLGLLFAEAEQDYCGRQAAIDRLFEYLLIQLLRYILDHHKTDIGLLAGLNDARLARAISAMHDAPGNNWSLELLAEKAGMSRARFAVHFRDTVGTTPVNHLTQCRLALAQTLLRKGKPVGLVANEVGYSNSAALTRLFKVQVGHSPKAWLKLNP
ncbi:AraC family transcriptional regulator [Methyloradius palustris]|uniref:AraC family transcriptional regulator n=1 Tax=Methyloradius palustris TaxID=2778876 RepID=A0A8D5JKF7_9PROT|nr:AraC family transcriptional regulator [Methyloradius palustris]BCM23875.1 AraC family transcriptional regulator [Methyloradius palustris]